MAQELYFLDRPRIDRLLERAIQSPVVIMCAGAGYGKTQAVSSFVRKSSAHTAWLQLSESDNDGSRFWEKFIDAVSTISPETAIELAKITFPETEQQFIRFMEIPLTMTSPADEFIFVYDDMHLISSDAVREFIRRSITSIMPNITSILMSRFALEMELAPCEKRGQVSQITESDLRFTKEEMIAYFRLLKLQPPAQTISTVYNDTEGWAFAIHLAGLMLQHSKTAEEYIPQSLRLNVFMLIESEVIKGLSPELRRFLIKLSLIELLVPDLLREIAGEGDYHLIDEMERIGSFIQFDAYLNAYRIHHLMLDYLRGKQDELSEDEKRQIWKQAAGWYRRNNHQMDAINYYQKAGDYTGLLAVMASLPVNLSLKTINRMLHILDSLPQDLLATSPTAAFLYPRMLASRGDFERSNAEFKKLIDRLETSKVIGADAAMIISLCYSSIGLSGMVTCLKDRDYSFTHYFEKAKQYAEISPYKPGPPNTVLSVGSYTCRAVDPQEMENYNDMLSRSIPNLAAALNGCGFGMDDLGRAELAFFKGDHINAEQLARAALDKARKNDQYEIAVAALFYLLRINMARGASDLVPSLLQEYDEVFREPLFLNHVVYRDLMYGFFYIQTNRAEKAAPWIKSDLEDTDLHHLLQGLETSVKAKYHLAKKRFSAVLADLELHDDMFMSQAFVLRRLENAVITAVCRYLMDDCEGAFRDMETAWELAKDNGLFMPFFEMGKDMRTLAGAALKAKSINIPQKELENIQRNAAAYAKNIYAVSEYFRETAAESQGFALTNREIEVLVCLSQGLTQREIGLQNAISINTVKSAVRIIYNKLGAINKSDAIRIATQKKIL